MATTSFRMAAVGSRARSAAGIGVIATLILVLAFGNVAYVDWATRNESTATAGGYLLRELTWPAWHLVPANGSGAAVQALLAADLRAILLIVFVALLLGLALAEVLASGSGLARFVLGWGCFILAAAIAGLVSAFLVANASVLGALLSAAGGAAYGLFWGWIIGLAAPAGRR
jgi:hypothetical protein